MVSPSAAEKPENDHPEAADQDVPRDDPFAEKPKAITPDTPPEEAPQEDDIGRPRGGPGGTPSPNAAGKEDDPDEQAKIVEEFPLPIPQGAKTQKAARLALSPGRIGFTLNFTVSGTVKEITDFYEQALKGRGLQVTRIERSSDFLIGAALLTTSEKEFVQGEMEQKKDDDTVTVFLQWQSKEAP